VFVLLDLVGFEHFCGSVGSLMVLVWIFQRYDSSVMVLYGSGLDLVGF